MQARQLTSALARAGTFVALLVACGAQTPAPKDATRTDTAVTPSKPSAPSAPAPKTPAGVAKPAPPPTPSAAPSLPAKDDTPLADLLRISPARVNVSSTTQDATHFPEHLVDYEMATAWQSRSGDLEPWIRIQIPTDARVERIELSVGYTKSLGRVDSFTQNFRITELTLSRDGHELGRFTLDPMSRQLQLVPVAGGGGTYELKVTRALSGSRPEWRHISVSELRVMGRAGTEQHAPIAPLVEVGNATPEQVTALNAGFSSSTSAEAAPTLAELCKAFIAKSAQAKCVPLAARFALPKSDTFLALHSVQTFDGWVTGTRLALRLPRGYVLLPVNVGVHGILDAASGSTLFPDKVDSIRIENDHLVLVVSGSSRALAPVGVAKSVQTKAEPLRGACWCQEANGVLTCRIHPLTSDGALGDFRITRDGLLHPH